MDYAKFSLADLINVVSALAFGFVCFLSLNYRSFGDTVFSIVGAAVIAIALCGLSQGAKLLKRSKRNFKASIIAEILFLVVFVIVAAIVVKPFSHFFAVTQQKEKIQNALIANIEHDENIFSAYEAYADNRLLIYESKLKSVVSGKRVNRSEYVAFGFNATVSDSEQIDTKLAILKTGLYPQGYEMMKNDNVEWLSNAKATLSNLRPIGTVTVVASLEPNLTALKDNLIDISKVRAKGKDNTIVETNVDDFDYNLDVTNVSNIFTTPQPPSALAILCAIGLYVLMLLPYCIAKRDSRFTGFKTVFGTNEMEDNIL